MAWLSPFQILEKGGFGGVNGCVVAARRELPYVGDRGGFWLLEKEMGELWIKGCGFGSYIGT